MSPSDYPRVVYRQISRRVLRQGDVAFCEFCQLRSPGGEPAGPGPEASVRPELPFFGAYTDFPIEVPQPVGGTEPRLVRVWTGHVMVMHQNCEIEYAADTDSRLLIAPLVSEAMWPDGPWAVLRRNVLPSFLYLPPMTEPPAGMQEDAWPEAVVALAGVSVVSRGLIKPRRLFSLSQEMLPHLQEKLSRFFTTRGFASTRELEALPGKTVLSAQRTDETVSGPSRLWKVVLGEGEDGDDEVTISLGCRP